MNKSIYTTSFIKHFALVIALSVTSMAAIADDGLTPGPGIFSGESGEVSLTKLFKRSEGKVQEPGSADASIDHTKHTSASTISRKQEVDFASYKEWRELNRQNPELYNDFYLWLEYKEFLQKKP